MKAEHSFDLRNAQRRSLPPPPPGKSQGKEPAWSSRASPAFRVRGRSWSCVWERGWGQSLNPGGWGDGGEQWARARPQRFLTAAPLAWEGSCGRQGSSAPASWEKTESSPEEQVEPRASGQPRSRGVVSSRYSWSHIRVTFDLRHRCTGRTRNLPGWTPVPGSGPGPPPAAGRWVCEQGRRASSPSSSCTWEQRAGVSASG